LRRFFAAKFWESPQRWLEELRLWEAARLLCCTTLAVKCICIDLGYADESHFCRRFKAYFGCTASEFAHRHGVRLALDAPLAEFAQVARKSGVAAALPFGVIVSADRGLQSGERPLKRSARRAG
jgi:AraC-like DNA-binding protein